MNKWIKVAAASTGIVATAVLVKAYGLPAQPATADLRMGVVIAATSARPIPCGNHSAAGCFRMFVEIRSSDKSIKHAGFVFENGDYFLTQSFAYLESGGVCKAYVDVSLPRVTVWSGGGALLTLPDDPATESDTQPYAFPVEFRCDQPVRMGENAQVQLSIAVGNGTYGRGGYSADRLERANIVHFKWPDIQVSPQSIK